MLAHRTLSLVVTLITITIADASAQTAFWDFMGGPAGGNVVSLRHMSWGEIVVGLEDEGFSTSSDGGRTWSKHDPLFRTIPAIAEHRGSVYIGGRGAHRRDAGAEWTRVYSFGTAVGEIVSLDTFLFIYAQGWRRSTDRGATWTDAGLPLRGRTVEAGGHAILWADNGIRRTTDGVTSTTIAMPGAVRHLAAGDRDAIVICDGAVLWSSDAGASWREVPTTIELTSIAAIAVSRSRPGIAAAIITDSQKRSHVEVTIDNGATWFGENLLQFDFATLNVVGFGGGDTILVGTNRGLFISPDLGRSWTMAGPGASSVRILSEPRRGTMYSVTNEHYMFRSDDAGRSWTSVGVNERLISGAVAIGEREVLVGTSTGLRVSSDGGTTWNAAGDDRLSTRALLKRRDTIYRVTSPHLSASQDDGASWQILATRPGSEDLRSIVISSTGDLYVGSSRSILRYHPASGSLIPLDPIPQPFTGPGRFSVGSDGLLFADHIGVLYRSLDSGTTWQRITIAEVQGNAISYLLPNDDMLAMSPEGVFRSFDRGDSWTKVGDIPDGRQASSLMLGSDGHLYASTYGGGLLRSRDRFSSAPDERQFVRAPRIEFIDGRVIIHATARPIDNAHVALHSIDGTRIATLGGGTLRADGALALELPEVPSGVYLVSVVAGGVTSSGTIRVVR